MAAMSFLNAPARDLPGAIPARSGIGLRAAHHADVMRSRPRVGFLEVHSENFFCEHSAPLDMLCELRADYPLSLHGVGLSLGSIDPLNQVHIQKLARLAARTEPSWVSDHLCWGSFGGEYFNDLLPLPYTTEALNYLVPRIDVVQSALRCQLAIENLSSYVDFAASEFHEWEFLIELARRSGCALLLDINNVYVSSRNLGFDAYEYVASIPPELVVEMHLAGHTRRTVNGHELLIDTHDQPVADAVWELYAFALERLGAKPTLIEWDSSIPPLATLLLEARRADCLQENCYDLAA
jgi:uncharacterized protein